jgi:hypothetical protein
VRLWQPEHVEKLLIIWYNSPHMSDEKYILLPHKFVVKFENAVNRAIALRDVELMRHLLDATIPLILAGFVDADKQISLIELNDQLSGVLYQVKQDPSKIKKNH